jgi:hypothetical protein
MAVPDVGVLLAAPLNPGNGGRGETSTLAYVVFGVLVVAVAVYMYLHRRGR